MWAGVKRGEQRVGTAAPVAILRAAAPHAGRLGAGGDGSLGGAHPADATGDAGYAAHIDDSHNDAVDRGWRGG